MEWSTPYLATSAPNLAAVGVGTSSRAAANVTQCGWIKVSVVTVGNLPRTLLWKIGLLTPQRLMRSATHVGDTNMSLSSSEITSSVGAMPSAIMYCFRNGYFSTSSFVKRGERSASMGTTFQPDPGLQIV